MEIQVSMDEGLEILWFFQNADIFPQSSSIALLYCQQWHFYLQSCNSYLLALPVLSTGRRRSLRWHIFYNYMILFNITRNVFFFKLKQISFSLNKILSCNPFSSKMQTEMFSQQLLCSMKWSLDYLIYATALWVINHIQLQGIMQSFMSCHIFKES